MEHFLSPVSELSGRVRYDIRSPGPSVSERKKPQIASDDFSSCFKAKPRRKDVILRFDFKLTNLAFFFSLKSARSKNYGGRSPSPDPCHHHQEHWNIVPPKEIRVRLMKEFNEFFHCTFTNSRVVPMHMSMVKYALTSKTLDLTVSILSGVPKFTKDRTLARRLVTGILKSDPDIDTVSSSTMALYLG